MSSPFDISKSLSYCTPFHEIMQVTIYNNSKHQKETLEPGGLQRCKDEEVVDEGGVAKTMLSRSLLLATLDRAFLITSFLQGVRGDKRWLVEGTCGPDVLGYKAMSLSSFCLTSSTRALAALFKPCLKQLRYN